MTTHAAKPLPDMGPCDDPSGCDAPATVHEPRPDHWHDGAWCAEHAPALRPAAVAAKPLTPTLLAALRALEAHPANPIRAGHVEAVTLAALRRRGLVGRVVEGRGKGQRTTSPLTAAGCAVLDAADGPSWSVTMCNHLHTPADPEDEPAFFTHEFRARSAAEAHAAAVAFGEAEGDCSPSGGVEDVDGPMWAAGGVAP